MKKQISLLVVVILVLSVILAACDLAAPADNQAESISMQAADTASGHTVQSDEKETNAEPETEEESIATSDGIKVVYGGTVRKGPGALSYTPAPGSGYFVVNGTVTENNGITMSINPVGILDYRLSLEIDEDTQVKAEIRVAKNGEELVTYAEENVQLQAGTCQFDACVDTGESVKCSGMYEVKFYIDDRLVSKTMEYV